MLIGEYRHTTDEKNRISMPSKFRKEVGKKVVITKGFDGCLFLYSLDEWAKATPQLNQRGIGSSDIRSLSRYIFASAVEVEVDSNGRILIPEFLRKYADVKGKVVFAGVNNRIELWNEKKWDEYKKRMDKQADIIAEKLGEIGSF